MTTGAPDRRADRHRLPHQQQHQERGSGSLLVVAVMLVVLTLAGAALIIGGYHVAAHRARSAADLAALSGAAALTRGGDPCDVARSVVARASTSRSPVSVRRCERVGDQLDFVVSIQVDVTVPTLLPGLPRTVSAVGHAGPVTSGEERDGGS